MNLRVMMCGDDENGLVEIDISDYELKSDDEEMMRMVWTRLMFI